MSAGGGSYVGCLGPGQQQAPQQAPHTRARGSGTPREAGASLGPMKVAMTHRNILPAASALATTRKGKRTRRDTRLLTSRASDVLDAGHVPALRIHDKGANPRHADVEILVLDALNLYCHRGPP